ncbi:GtrA family protein [Cupriavidus basilensis]|uniref:GtrA family protein n=1 Tax=Cupriavidus basilensis TaxID=68895 RepID=UPI0009D9F247|nr:GtrA family protein [Cupriavidus basilensis]
MRFALSGVAATLLHVTTASTLIAWDLASPMLANGVAFITATGCSYLLNTLWSFSSRLHRKNLARLRTPPKNSSTESSEA